AAVEEKRQVVLDAGGGDAVAYIPVQRRAARVALEEFAPPSAKSAARGLVEREFAPRKQANIGDRVQAALRVRVKGADRIDRVVGKVEAVRNCRAGGEQIDQASANREFARGHDLR